MTRFQRPRPTPKYHFVIYLLSLDLPNIEYLILEQNMNHLVEPSTNSTLNNEDLRRVANIDFDTAKNKLP